MSAITGVRGAVVCVTLIDRLQSDLMSPPDVERYVWVVENLTQLEQAPTVNC